MSDAELRASAGGRWLSGALIAVVGLSLALGGGTRQGLWSDAVVEIGSLPLLGLVFARLAAGVLPGSAKWPFALSASVILLFFLQLVPLPPVVWASLPGRATFAAAFQAEGMALPWEPLSLDPGATWFSFLSLLPALAVFLAVPFVDLKTRRLVSLVILGFAFANVLLGLAQLAGGPESPLRFYSPANTSDSVGFFANRNHYAALLTAAVPLSAAWFVGLSRELNAKRGRVLIVLIVAYAIILLGLGVAHSRAGLILAFVGGLASVALAWRTTAKRDKSWGGIKLPLIFLGANVCGLLLAFQFGFVGLANRIEDQSVLEDLRWPIARVTAEATAANLPLGVGFGAFEPVYQMFEPRAATLPLYVNHAHDDWLELTLDGGAPAIAAGLAFLAWCVIQGTRAWRAPFEGGRAIDKALARAGSIVIGLLLLHSTVDYPLRTTALITVFAFSAGLMSPPTGAGSSTKRCGITDGTKYV